MRRLVLCLSLTLSSAFAAASASAAESVSIWWAQWAPADGLQQLGEEYRAKTGVEVKVHQIPWGSFQDQVFLNFGNKTTDFDIVVGDSQWIGRGATKGLYADLTTWLPQAVDLKSVHPLALKYLCEYPAGSAHYFAAPCEIDAVGLAYRKDWFTDPAEQAAFKKAYGRDLVVPETWEDFAQVASFFQRPASGRAGCALLTGRGYDALAMGFQQVLWSWGGAWGDPASYAVHGQLDSPASVEALTFFKQLMASGPKGATNLDYGNVLEVFTNGSTAMSCTYFAFFPTIAKSMGDKVGFAVMPSHAGKRVISLGGQGMSVSTKVSAERQQAAKAFMAWFLTTEVQQRWITKEGGFTANTAILNSAAFKQASPYNAAFAASLDHVQDFWNVPCYNELLAAAVKHLGEALDGSVTPQAALQAIATEHESIFEDAGLKK